MSFLNAKFSEKNAVLATLDPSSMAASTVLTAYVPVQSWHSIAAVIQSGVLGAAATLDAKLRQAQDASGTGVKDITGKSVTQILKSAGDNKQAFIECRAEDLDATNGFGWVCLSVTVGTAASLVSAVLFGTNPRYESATASNQAGVVQII